MNYIQSILKTKGLKVTPQRIAILNEIEKYGHISIDDIFKRIKDSFPSISLATIYKNINSLKEKDIISEIQIQNCKSKYEIKKEDHGHFICQICKTLKDLEIDRDNFKNYGEFNHIDLYIYGICKECKTKN